MLTALAPAWRDQTAAANNTPCKTFGLSQEFLDHGLREAILDAAGLSAAPGPAAWRAPWRARRGRCPRRRGGRCGI